MQIPAVQVFILLAVHLCVGARRLVALAAEVEQSVDDDAAHFVQPCGAVKACVVGDGLDVDEDVARDDA